MEFKKETLDNGLTLVGEINPSAKSAAAGFFVKTGARDETDDINGVSHFLEHMVFKGNEKLDAFQVSQAFDSLGARFNAFTSEEITVFYASVLPEYIEKIVSLWSDILEPSLRDEDFNVEKNVIKEEIAMYQDTPTFDVMDRCRNLYFKGHPCSKSVLGTVESIDALTASQMREYFSKRYAPNNISLAVAGNFDWDRMKEIAARHCGHWQKKQTSRQTTDWPGTIEKQRLAKPNVRQEHICLMSPAVPAQDQRRFAALLLSRVIGDATGSRYFWELVDKALAETAYMDLGPMDGTGELHSYIRCASKNVDKVLDTVNRIFSDIKENGITDQELQKAKNKLVSSIVIKNEVPLGRLVDLGVNWLYLHEYRSIEQDIDAFKEVTRDQVEDFAREFDPARYTIFSIGPE